MVKNHLKRLAAPKTWKIHRKKTVFITKPKPGPHSIYYSVPIRLALTELLDIARNKKEVNVILNDKNVLVDGVVRRDPKFPVGLFDVFEISKLKKYFRIIINQNFNLDFLEISESEAKLKPCKIVGKKKIGKKFQLNLFDGKNILTDDNKFKVGDVLLLKLPDLEIKEHLQFSKNKTIFLIGGKQAGNVGRIEDTKRDTIIYKDNLGDIHETLKKYAYVVGNDKPMIKLSK